MTGEEGARLHGILGRDPQPPAGAGEIGHGHLVHVSHGLHVEPALRGGHHQVRPAEPERAQQLDLGVEVPAAFAQQVLADDPEVDLARLQGGRDLGGGQKRSLHVLDPGQDRAIAPLTAGDVDSEATAGEPRLGLVLQPALGRQGDQQRPAHRSPSA